MHSRKGKYVGWSIVGIILVSIASLTVILSLPSTHRKLGTYFGNALSKKIGTSVNIDKACYIFPNRIVLEGVNVKDQEGRDMIQAKNIGTSILLPELTSDKWSLGNINLSIVQLDEPKFEIVRDETGTFNFQFAIDSLSSTDSEGSTQLSIGTIVINKLYARYTDGSSGSRLQLKRFNVVARNFKLNEKGANVNLNDISFDEVKLSTAERDIAAKDFKMKSDIALTASNNHSIRCNIEDTEFTLNDETYEILNSELFYNDNSLTLHNLHLQSDNGFALNGNGVYDISRKAYSAHIDKFQLTSASTKTVNRYIPLGEDFNAILSKMGTISLSGNVTGDSTNTQFTGDILTDIGTVTADAKLNGTKISGDVSANSLQIGKLLNEPKLGKTTFEASLGIDFNHPLEENQINAFIKNIEYGGYQYNNIKIDEVLSDNVMECTLDVSDPKLRIASDFTAVPDFKSKPFIKSIKGNIDLYAERLALYPIMAANSPGSIAVRMNADIKGTDIKTATGNVQIESLHLVTDKDSYSFNDYNINVSRTDDALRHISISTDFASAELNGDIDIESLYQGVMNQVSRHLPSLLGSYPATSNDFDFDVTVSQSDILKKFIGEDIILDSPVHLYGNIDCPDQLMHVDIHIPQISYADNVFQNSHLVLSGNTGKANLTGRIERLVDENTSTFIINADADDDIVQSTIDWNIGGSKNLHGILKTDASFTKTLGSLATSLDIQQSYAYFDDMAWIIHPSHIDIENGNINIQELELVSEDRFIWASGTVSENPEDSIVTEFRGFDIAYLQDLLNFHPVDFGGNMRGQARLSNLYHTPDISADVTIDSLLFETGYLGTADIRVGWDKELNGIRIYGHIVDEGDKDNHNVWKKTRITDVVGYVAPGEIRDDIQLRIEAQNTSASFINGFLGGVFKDINGDVNGVLRVSTLGENGVNLLGKMSVDTDLRLRATNTLYHVDKNDSIEFKLGAFEFNNVRIHDTRGKTGYVKGKVTHHKLRNFAYDFNIDFEDLLLYDEKEFNSDKFLATVYADGRLTLSGADGHDLHMNADVTPTEGSVFAYDAATPDAITTGSFVTFRDKKGARQAEDISLDQETVDKKDAHKYSSDIFMDINIHVNPDCAVKLRMDNNADGYITTYGNGTLLARYHDKSPFTMQGIYQIDGGKYRLYLQDIIYRDLELQTGSNVTFNGNPFDANIHLICWHTLPSVPLSDLTSSAEFMQNNKVKVICALDITGQLGNMNFGFDVQLPNVSDETRQLVKSLISTEEEMNMQMIYLLGLGRFYTNEIARAQGKTSSGTEVSSLVSSTISGQLNNILDNVIGTNSKWSFGTGLTTGEKGWDDLDVEGTLSGSLLNDRLLINGNFGYRDNSLTNKANFVGDFDVRYRLFPTGNIYLKAYNQTNDKYFTKSTLNTQGIGISYQKEFDNWKNLFRKKKRTTITDTPVDTISNK